MHQVINPVHKSTFGMDVLVVAHNYHMQIHATRATCSGTLLDCGATGPHCGHRRHGELQVRRVRPACAASTLVHQLKANRTGVHAVNVNV